MCEKIEARFVRGNAFKFQIEVIAYTETGRRVENFELGEAVLKCGTKTPLTVKTYEVVEGTTILVLFDGSQSLGIYGMEMTGTYEGEAWRWAYRKVFQIVETNEAAHLPEGCVVLKDTLFMTAEVVMSGGGSFEQVQADWLESDPESPAFIKNKPNLSNYLTSAYEVVTALVTLDSETGKYTFSSPQYNALFAAWNTGKIPVLRLKDSSSVHERIIANMPMFLGGKDGLTSFYGVEQQGNTKYVFAYVGSLQQAANSYAKVIDVQEEIEDLDTIRSNAATGATALQEAYEVVTALVTLDSETGKYTFSSPQYNALFAAWNTGKIPVLRLKDSSSVQEKIVANMPMFLGGKDGLTSFYGVEQQGNTKYVFAYVGSLQQAANSYAKVVDIQEAIQDLDTIRSGAAAGATALQEAYVVIDGGTKTKTGDIYNFANTTIAAINTAWTAGKVPVLTATLSDDSVKFVAVISKNADNKFFGEFFVGNTRYQFTSLAYSQFATGSISATVAEVTTNKVTSISSLSTDIQYPSAKAVYDEVGNVEDVLDAILGADTLHEQKKMDIVSASGTTLSAAVNTYYNFASEVNTLAVTLPSVTDSTHINNIVFMLTTGSTPSVTFAAPTGINVIAQDGFSIEASTTYEINAIFNGVAWVIACMKLSTTPINS